MFFTRTFTKSEKGMILLENLSEESSKISSHELMKSIDKRQIIGIDEAKGAMAAMATFHGILWNFYKGHCSPVLENGDQSYCTFKRTYNFISRTLWLSPHIKN